MTDLRGRHSRLRLNLGSRGRNCATGVARDKESDSSTCQKFQVGQLSERSGIFRLSRMAMSDLV